MGSKDTQFQIGHSGGPGRPKGSKNKLAESYLQDLYEHYLEHGKEAIQWLFENDRAVYVKLIAQLIPKDLDIKHSGDITVQVVNYDDGESVPAEEDNDPMPQTHALKQVI